jgi:uncharacterized protein (DUF2267 family)
MTKLPAGPKYKDIIPIMAKGLGCCLLNGDKEIIEEATKALGKAIEVMKDIILDFIQEAFSNEFKGETKEEVETVAAYFLKFWVPQPADWERIEKILQDKAAIRQYLHCILQGIGLKDWGKCKKNVSAVFAKLQEQFKQSEHKALLGSLDAEAAAFFTYVIETNPHLHCNCGDVFEVEHDTERHIIKCTCGTDKKCDFSPEFTQGNAAPAETS